MVEQSSGQDDVIDSKKNLSKLTVELVLNQVYFPALAQLRKSCYKGLSQMGMQQAAVQFINAWLDLDSLIRTNLSHVNDGKLKEIEDTVLTFFDSGGSRDYTRLMQIGMEYANVTKDSGLFNLTLERTAFMVNTISNPVKIKNGE